MKNLTLLIFYFLFIFNASAFSANTENPRRLNKKIKKDFCTDQSLGVYNILNIQWGIENDEMLPASCLGKNEALCHREILLSNRFTELEAPAKNEMVIRARKFAESKFNTWEKVTENQKISFYTEHQIKIFDDIWKVIKKLREQYQYIEVSKKIKGGNCAEHTYSNLHKFLRAAVELKKEIKLQVVSVTSSKMQDNHQYLLLDSNVSDIKIVNDAKKVGKFLKTIVDGDICDTWNGGYFKEFKNDKSGFYKSATMWDTLEIASYSLKFDEFGILPLPAQEKICTELTKMQLDLETPKNACKELKEKSKTIGKPDL